MNGRVFSLKKTELIELQEMMVQAMASTATPPATICRSERWQRFFKRLNPAFVMPDRNAAGGRFLEQEYSCLRVKR